MPKRILSYLLKITIIIGAFFCTSKIANSVVYNVEPIDKDQLQKIVSMVYGETVALDDLKVVIGDRYSMFGQTPFYLVKLFSDIPVNTIGNLVRFDGASFSVSQDSYEIGECIDRSDKHCYGTNLYYANLKGLVSKDVNDDIFTDLIQINSDIEDTALERLLNIINTPLLQIIESNIPEKYGKIIDVNTEQYSTITNLKPEKILLIKPQIIRLRKARTGQRYYSVDFWQPNKQKSNNFVMKVSFSGINGQDISIKIEHGPIP